MQVDLTDNHLGPEGAKAIASGIRDNSSVTRLDVSWNDLNRGGEGVKLLRDAVKGRKGFALIDGNNG